MTEKNKLVTLPLIMGSRTSNHIIEDESRLFFRSLLPKLWVYRDKTEDYGIDSEVEIFDEKGNPTGLVFWVQLKGTASKDVKVIQNFSFKNEKLDQFRNYDIPVLIARYSTFNKALYLRWAKSVVRLNREANSTKVIFLDDDRWTNDTPHQIINYLGRQSAIRQGKVRVPIKTFLKRKQANLALPVPYSNLVLIKNYIASNKYFTLTNEEEDSLLQVIVENKQIIFSFTDLAFSSLGINFDNSSSQLDEKTKKYVSLTFCSSLFELGRDDLGSSFFFSNELFSVVKQVPHYLLHFLPHLLNGPELSKTMRLVNKFLNEEEQHNNLIESTVNMFLLSERDNLDDEQLGLAEEFLLQNLTRAQNWKDPIATGSACYNLANFYRGQGNYEHSLFYYLEARRYKPGYKTHAYYYHEIAGLLFLLGRYKFATSFYKKVLSLDPDSIMVKGLLADCLMYAGEYEAAVDQLDEFLTEKHNQIENPDEWYLKFTCLQTLLFNEYPTIQKRDLEKALLLAKEGDYNNALLSDMMCPLAWFNKGVMGANSGKELDAFIAFVMAGLICNNDVQAWTNATILGIHESIEKILLINVIRTAYFYNKQTYVKKVFETLSKSDPAQRDHIMEILDKTLPKYIEKPLLVRVFENDTDYISINLRG